MVALTPVGVRSRGILAARLDLLNGAFPGRRRYHPAMLTWESNCVIPLGRTTPVSGWEQAARRVTAIVIETNQRIPAP
jgi:hypothetical protein